MNSEGLKWFAELPFTGTILDVGSYNVNGQLRDVIPVTIGIDIREGAGVDNVMDVCQLRVGYGEESFDNIVSSYTLEHCRDILGAIENIFSVCRTGGLIAVAVPTHRHMRHNMPLDYWRFSLSILKRIFQGNEIISTLEIGRSVGIAVKKNKLTLPIMALRSAWR